MAFSVGPGIQLGGGIVLGAPNLGPPKIGTVITTSTTGSSYTSYAVTVPFSAPCSNVVCSPITSYVATSIPPGNSGTGTTSPITIGNLIYGQPYTFSVSAINASGIGAASVTSNSISGYGTLWSWGLNSNNQLGLGTVGATNSYSNPTQVGPTATWTTSTTNAKIHASWITPNGALYSWGYNAYGQLGIGNTTQYSSPKQVGALTNWLQVSGAYSVVAIKTDGSLWTWGNGAQGQNGLGNTTSYSSPKQVGSLTTWRQASSSGDSTSNSHVLAVKTDNTLWAWGGNNSGQLGTNNSTNYSSPKQIGSLTIWLAVAAGYRFSLAVDVNGKIWSWGNNASYGMLGLNNTTSYSSPKQVGALTNWSTQIVVGNQYSAGAIKTDGTLWMWGYNGYGELGTNNTTSYSSPKQIGALTTWRQLAHGQYSSLQHTLGLTSDGKLYAWGNNQYGQLGVGNTTNYSSPKQVGTTSAWHSIGVTGGSSYAVQTTNVFGPPPPTNLTVTGINANTLKITVTSPSYTGTPQQWSFTSTPGNFSTSSQSTTTYLYNVSQAAIGAAPTYYSFTATTTNQVGTSVASTASNSATGTTYLSLWGYGGSGSLGYNNTTNYSSPKNLGTYAGWGWQYQTTAASGFNTINTAAITNDGKLFMWGNNTYGQLGNNTTNNYSSPVQVGVNSNWAAVSTDSHTLAVDTSGRLWAWGSNQYGQLGLNNSTNYSSPKQVGALTNWSKVYVGFNNSYAIKTDNTGWSWGNGANYAHGNGSTASYSSPRQLANSNSSWLMFSPGYQHFMGIGTNNQAYGWGSQVYPNYYAYFYGSSGQYTTPQACNQGPGGGAVWASVATRKNGSYWGSHAVDTSGRFWSTGVYGTYGEAGVSSAQSSNYLSATQIGSFTNWYSVSASDTHVVAMTTSGTIYSWGYNAYGQLGLNNNTSYSSPKQVGTLSNWNYPVAPAHTRYNYAAPVAGLYITMLQHT